MRRLPLDASALKSKMDKNLELAIEMMGEALTAMAEDKFAKPTAKFRMGQEYIALFMQLDVHIMKEQNHKADAKLKKLDYQRKAMALEDTNHPANQSGARDPLKPIDQPRFDPTMPKS